MDNFAPLALIALSLAASIYLFCQLRSILMKSYLATFSLTTLSVFVVSLISPNPLIMSPSQRSAIIAERASIAVEATIRIHPNHASYNKEEAEGFYHELTHQLDLAHMPPLRRWIEKFL